MDKVYQSGNLFSAYRAVAANTGAPGVDQITIEDFGAHLAKNVEQLEQHLRDGTYRPQAIRRVHIPKPGTNETRPHAAPHQDQNRPRGRGRFRVPW
jgi:RNA-directed DNA polymerase